LRKPRGPRVQGGSSHKTERWRIEEARFCTAIISVNGWPSSKTRWRTKRRIGRRKRRCARSPFGGPVKFRSTPYAGKISKPQARQAHQEFEQGWRRVGRRALEFRATRRSSAMASLHCRATASNEHAQRPADDRIRRSRCGLSWRAARRGVPSTGKIGGAGTAIDVPLAHKDALYVRSHYDTMTVTLTDAPQPEKS